MHLRYKIILFTIILLLQTFQILIAAVPLDLKNQPTDILKPSHTFFYRPDNITFNEINRHIDFNNTLHIRFQESYHDYPIWNAHAVLHVPYLKNRKFISLEKALTDGKSITMNGMLYKNLVADLEQTFNISASAARLKEVKQYVINHYRHTNNINSMTDVHNKLLIYVDKQHKAHWTYQINFYVPPLTTSDLPSKPNYLIDAMTFKIYQKWDDIKTMNHHDMVTGGGLGGNKNSQLIYDSLSQHLQAFTIQRDETGICYLQNTQIVVIKHNTEEVMHFNCDKTDQEHNNIYWSADFDAVNGGYSPANDAMFGGQIVKSLYQNWYNIPVLVNPDGSEMLLQMFVHVPKLDNAYWNGSSVTFGDGKGLYPLTSLGIIAHEVSHGFTEQHADLHYYEESGGINEAFSDMAAQAAEFFINGRNTWQIGSEVFKIENESLRYMDHPSKDCYGKEPGTFCSIEHVNQYYDGLDVHFSSGIYNFIFYLMSTANNWDAKKAFHVMLHANASYWTPDINFAEGAACVVKSAQDLKYDTHTIIQAFNTVGIDATSPCTSIQKE